MADVFSKMLMKVATARLIKGLLPQVLVEVSSVSIMLMNTAVFLEHRVEFARNLKRFLHVLKTCLACLSIAKNLTL